MHILWFPFLMPAQYSSHTSSVPVFYEHAPFVYVNQVDYHMSRTCATCMINACVIPLLSRFTHICNAYFRDADGASSLCLICMRYHLDVMQAHCLFLMPTLFCCGKFYWTLPPFYGLQVNQIYYGAQYYSLNVMSCYICIITLLYKRKFTPKSFTC